MGAGLLRPSCLGQRGRVHGAVAGVSVGQLHGAPQGLHRVGDAAVDELYAPEERPPEGEVGADVEDGAILGPGSLVVPGEVADRPGGRVDDVGERIEAAGDLDLLESLVEAALVGQVDGEPVSGGGVSRIELDGPAVRGFGSFAVVVVVVKESRQGHVGLGEGAVQRDGSEGCRLRSRHGLSRLEVAVVGQELPRVG